MADVELAKAETGPALIGPLTAEEWCEFRMRDDGDDLLQCCATTSDMRDAVFYLLRMGADYPAARFLTAWRRLLDHGLPDGRGRELLQRIHDYYAGMRDRQVT